MFKTDGGSKFRGSETFTVKGELSKVASKIVTSGFQSGMERRGKWTAEVFYDIYTAEC
jgi:hypothetical protein